MNKLFKVLWVIFIVSIAGNSLADTTAFFKDNPDGSRTLKGHMPKEVSTSSLMSHLDPNRTLDLRIILPLQNQTQLSSLLQSVYDPSSPNFHQFLTPAQFAQQYGPSPIDISDVKNFLKSQGLSVTDQSSNGLILHVTGPVNALENAFKLHINNYQKSDGTKFFAPDADPTISAQMVGKVSGIVGMSNLVIIKPLFHRVTNGLISAQLATPKTTVTTGPAANLTPSDVKTAYNLNTIPVISNPATFQNIALVEFDGYLPSDVGVYLGTYVPLASNFNNPCNYIDNYSSITKPVYVPTNFNSPSNPSCSAANILQNVLVNGFNGIPTGSGGSDEVTLDIEELLGIANDSINSVYVYEAANDNTGTDWTDEWSQIATDDIAKIVSCSWGYPEDDAPVVSFDNQILQQMAAQGQEVFAASGDSGSYEDPSAPGVVTAGEPSAQPFLTGVGISLLNVYTSGPNTWSYVNESASTIGGGGVSIYNLIPSYQDAMALKSIAASKVSTTMRNVPDVVLTADSSTPYLFYVTDLTAFGPSWYSFYGSSVAAPTWAAFLAKVNQARVNDGESVIGFVNPALYSIAQSSKYANDFHDITTGNNGYYPAETGLDDATGLGSFNGAKLYNDLVSYAAPTSIPSAPSALIASPGNNLVVLSWGVSVGATSYNVKRSTVSGGPYTTIASAVTSTTYTDTTVVNGTMYYYVVSAANSKGVSANSSQTSVKPQAQPAAPINLTANLNGNAILINWTQSTSVITANNIYRSVLNGPYTLLGTMGPGIWFSDTSINPNGTYNYYVTAVNASNIESGHSNTATVSAAPAAPVGLTISLGSGSATLSWTAGVWAESYNIKRATVSGGPYTTIASAVTSTTYTDSSENSSYIYYYVVSAVNPGGESLNSAEVTTLPAPIVSVSDTNSSITLSWQADVRAVSYKIQRSAVSGGPYTTILTTTSITYTDTSIPMGTLYYYVVSAVNSAGKISVNSAQVQAGPVPLAPTSLTVHDDGSDISLQWQASTGATTYAVLRGIQSGKYNVAYSSSHPSYLDQNVAYGKTYYYVVKAGNAAGVSPNSNEVSASLLAPATGLTATAGCGQVVLAWTASTQATGYRIERGTKSGEYSTSFATTTANYTDTTVINGTEYFYVVRATNAIGDSAVSNQVSATPIGPIITTQPVSLTVTAPAAASFSVVASGSAPLGYQWQLNGSNIAGATSSTYTISPTIPSNSGSYSVKVSNSAGSVTSSVATLTVNPTPPYQCGNWMSGDTCVQGGSYAAINDGGAIKSANQCASWCYQQSLPSPVTCVTYSPTYLACLCYTGSATPGTGPDGTYSAAACS